MYADNDTEAQLRTATAQLLIMRRKYDDALANVEIAQSTLAMVMLRSNAASARADKCRSLNGANDISRATRAIFDAAVEARRAIKAATDALEMAKIEPGAVEAEVQAAVLAVEIATRRHSMRAGARPITTAPAPMPTPAPVRMYGGGDDSDDSGDGVAIDEDAPPAYIDS